MQKVVERGTARIARIKGIEVCGKTGTAENFTRIDGKRMQLTDHSIFVAFAPKENPQIALAVFIENGYWGALGRSHRQSNDRKLFNGRSQQKAGEAYARW